MIANADQIKLWNGVNGEKWVRRQADFDHNLADATAGVIPLAAAKSGERVLDIGCGSGQASYLLAEAVGPGGHVTGVDISAPLIAAARRRDSRAKNTTFIEADAAVHSFEPQFDLIFSRFGVMFFDDPPAAFANIRKGLRAGGRLAFVCWRSAAENEWITVPAAAARDDLPLQSLPDPLAPGPFAFADARHIEGILTRAGFRDVRVKKLDGPCTLASRLTRLLSRSSTKARSPPRCWRPTRRHRDESVPRSDPRWRKSAGTASSSRASPAGWLPRRPEPTGGHWYRAFCLYLRRRSLYQRQQTGGGARCSFRRCVCFDFQPSRKFLSSVAPVVRHRSPVHVQDGGRFMAQYQFKIGETISFQSSLRNRSAATGQYRVIGLRPSDDGEPSYRIKSDLERHERIARESELKIG